MIDVLSQGKTTGTKATIGDWMLRVAYRFNKFAVFHIKLQTTSHRVVARRRPSTGLNDSTTVFFVLP
jgi:hypothetical protein